MTDRWTVRSGLRGQGETGGRQGEMGAGGEGGMGVPKGRDGHRFVERRIAKNGSEPWYVHI